MIRINIINILNILTLCLQHAVRQRVDGFQWKFSRLVKHLGPLFKYSVFDILVGLIKYQSTWFQLHILLYVMVYCVHSSQVESTNDNIR